MEELRIGKELEKKKKEKKAQQEIERLKAKLLEKEKTPKKAKPKPPALKKPLFFTVLVLFFALVWFFVLPLFYSSSQVKEIQSNAFIQEDILTIQVKLLNEKGKSITESGSLKIETINFYGKRVYSKKIGIQAGDFEKRNQEHWFTKKIPLLALEKGVDPYGTITVEFATGNKTFTLKREVNGLPLIENESKLKNPENYIAEPGKLWGPYVFRTERKLNIFFRLLKGFHYVSCGGNLRVLIKGGNGENLFKKTLSVTPKDFTFSAPGDKANLLALAFQIPVKEISKGTVQKARLEIEFLTEKGNTLKGEQFIDLNTKKIEPIEPDTNALPSPTPTPSATPITKPTPSPSLTPTPKTFKKLQTKTFRLESCPGKILFSLSFPLDWNKTAYRTYGLESEGSFSFDSKEHLRECEENFSECIQEKYPAQKWKEITLKECSKPAVTRVVFEKTNSIQRELWMNFSKEEKIVMVKCTAKNQQKDNQLCQKILKSLKC